VPLFTSGGFGLGLVILVLVLRIWSCLHHWLLLRHAKRKRGTSCCRVSVRLSVGHNCVLNRRG